MDYEGVAGAAAGFIRREVAAAGAAGVVLGLGGEIGSAVAAHLSARGVGPDSCLALIMPNSDLVPESEIDDGRTVAEALGIEHRAVHLGGLAAAAAGAGGDGESEFAGGEEERKGAACDLSASLRAAVLRYEARKRNRLVVGTDDRTECLVGRFAWCGGGASDMLPIADLYRTQVQRLGLHLGVPRRIVEKSPSPRLRKDRGGAAAGPGMEYAAVDGILAAMDGEGGAAGMPRDATAEAVDRIGALRAASERRRRLPPIARLRGAGRQGYEEEEEEAAAAAAAAPQTNPARRAAERRPWGGFERFTLNQTTTVKIIRVDPRAALSLQLHSRRSEYWLLLDGSATAILGSEKVAMEPGADCYVPAGTVHRITAGAEGARLLEIAFGDFSEDDIVRLQDAWGRG